MSIYYSNFGQTIRFNDLSRQLSQLIMGLEVEMHRVNRQDGHLSNRVYPTSLGDPVQHHAIKNDFGYTQMEVITPANVNVFASLDMLAALNDTVRKNLAADESLWLYSMPPVLNPGRTEFKIAPADPVKTAYMETVVARRDIARSITSGVHINLGLALDVLHYVYHQFFEDQYQNEVDFTNSLYMKIAQGLMHYRWVFTLLFGEAPVADASFYEGRDSLQGYVRSVRSSSYGFGNGVTGSYQDVDSYIAKVKEDVALGDLIAEREFYDVVRLKGQDELADLATKGVQYLELRMFDLDALSKTGVSEVMVQFTELLFVYLMMTESVVPDDHDVDEFLQESRQRNESVALEDPFNVSKYQAEALSLLSNLEEFAYDNRFKADWLPELRRRLTDPLESPAAKLITFLTDDFYQGMLALSNQRQVGQLRLRGLAGFSDLPLTEQKQLQAELVAHGDVNVVNRRLGTFFVQIQGQEYLLSKKGLFQKNE
ncbi:hypothetical protein [Convivina intestini]|uniref:hypothetical protein n=1 Tax=Convivina intestini TaxID=1505726 RepID=UPI00200F612F|nr:hypothetical protein [Convivina intestini]CAH1851945.1 Glutathione biosynthesis bifunctional protein GshAB [Convivina intestini]